MPTLQKVTSKSRDVEKNPKKQKPERQVRRHFSQIRFPLKLQIKTCSYADCHTIIDFLSSPILTIPY